MIPDKQKSPFKWGHAKGCPPPESDVQETEDAPEEKWQIGVTDEAVINLFNSFPPAVKAAAVEYGLNEVEWPEK